MAKYKAGDRFRDEYGKVREILFVGEKKYLYKDSGGNEWGGNIASIDKANYELVRPFFEVGKTYKYKNAVIGPTYYEITAVDEWPEATDEGYERYALARYTETGRSGDPTGKGVIGLGHFDFKSMNEVSF